MHAALRRRRRQKRIECSQMHRKGGKKQQEELTLRGEEYVKQALAEAEAECQTLRETADRRKPEVVDRLIAELV